MVVQGEKPDLVTIAPSPTPAVDAGPLAIVLAVDGSPSSIGAVHTAAALACGSHAKLRVVSVVEPPRSAWRSASTEAADLRRQSLDLDRLNVRHRSVTEALLCACPAMGKWPVDMELGDPVTHIAQAAARGQADVLVLGLPPREVSRGLRDETTMRAVRRATVPVFAVVPTLMRIPRAAVVGVDFSQSSLAAARVAARLLGPHGTLHLAHVKPDFGPVNHESEGMCAIYSHGIEAGFQQLIAELSVRGDLRIEPVLLEGSPAGAISAFADRVDADFVAVGTHRLEGHTALNVGRVTNALLRDGCRSVLVAPPTPLKGLPRNAVWLDDPV